MLFLYLTAFTVLLTILVIWHYTASRNVLNEKILQSNSETIDQASLTLGEYFRDIERYLFNLGTNAGLQDFLGNHVNEDGYQGIVEANEILDNILSSDVFSAKTSGVYIYAADKHNYPVYSRSAVNLTGGQRIDKGVFRSEEVESSEWYKEAVENHGRISWRVPEWDNVRQKTEFCVTRAIISSKKLKEVLGVIRVFVSVKDIGSMMDGISLGDHGGLYLFCNGNLFGFHDKETQDQIIDLLAEKEPGNGIEPFQLDGDPCYLIKREIAATGWCLAGIVYEKDINRQFDTMRNTAVLLLITGIMITAGMTAVISGQITKPIERIAHYMRHYKENQGDRLIVDREDEVGVLISSYNAMLDEIENLMQEVRDNVEKRRAAELNALQAQINPHLLYNTLDCINSLAYMKKDEEIIRLNVALSDFFRISLNKGEEMLPLERELLHVKNYCILQEYRLPGKFSLITHVPEELLQVRVIKLILQPLVENAIVHGFRGLKEKGMITIKAYRENQFLHIIVTDDGKGTDTEYLNGLLSGEYRKTDTDGISSGYGITNVNERIRLAFGNESGLVYHEPEMGYGVEAEIRIFIGETTEGTDEI